MGDLSANFSRSEFACKCGCGRDTIDFDTLRILQEMRTWIGQPMKIHSGFRCPVHNQAVGGAKNSQHLYGRAADFSFPAGDPSEPDPLHGGVVDLEWLRDILDRDYGARVSLGLYDTFIHLDTRTNGGKRWDERT